MTRPWKASAWALARQRRLCGGWCRRPHGAPVCALGTGGGLASNASQRQLLTRTVGGSRVAALGEHDAAKEDFEQAASLSPRYRPGGDDGGSDAGEGDGDAERGVIE